MFRSRLLGLGNAGLLEGLTDCADLTVQLVDSLHVVGEDNAKIGEGFPIALRDCHFLQQRRVHFGNHYLRHHHHRGLRAGGQEQRENHQVAGHWCLLG